MSYVLSTLTAAQDYSFYTKSIDGVQRVEKVIHINGGANVANKHFVTKDGVMTELTDEDVGLLESHPVFKLHKENGYVKIFKSEKDESRVLLDMEKADASAPLTPATYEKKGKRKPKTERG